MIFTNKIIFFFALKTITIIEDYHYPAKQLRVSRSSKTIVLIIFGLSTLQKLINPSIFLLIIAIYMNPMEVRDP